MSATNWLATSAGRLLRTRWVVRAPVRLYRMRLGFLLGNRMLLLEHRGRRTGQRRYAVLEVVDRPAPDTFVIVSGFGSASQWYRNVVADPRVRISVGLRRNVEAVAEPLSTDAAEAVLARYAEHHPRAWDTMRRTLEETLNSDDLQLPMFAVRVARPLAV